MATTSELQAIIEELQLVDVGDAARYLGEEVLVEDESVVPNLQASFSGSSVEFYVTSCSD